MMGKKGKYDRNHISLGDFERVMEDLMSEDKDLTAPVID